MEWSKKFEQAAQPSFEEIEAFIGSNLWQGLNSALQERYRVMPALSFSKCAAQPGWNVKYKKGGKSLCTLYPMDGFFIALVTIGNKETHELEQTLSSYSEYTQDLYRRTSFSCGGRWLMINVTEKAILNDVVNLVDLRARTK